MSEMYSFILAVAAGVVAYYICKWLARHTKDHQAQKAPESGSSPGLSRIEKL